MDGWMIKDEGREEWERIIKNSPMICAGSSSFLSVR